MAYTKGQKWGALKKSWRGYRAALATGDARRVNLYSKRITALQQQLGLKKTKLTGKARKSPKATRRVRRTSPRRATKKRSSPQARMRMRVL